MLALKVVVELQVRWQAGQAIRLALHRRGAPAAGAAAPGRARPQPQRLRARGGAAALHRQARLAACTAVQRCDHGLLRLLGAHGAPPPSLLSSRVAAAADAAARAAPSAAAAGAAAGPASRS